MVGPLCATSCSGDSSHGSSSCSKKPRHGGAADATSAPLQRAGAGMEMGVHRIRSMPLTWGLDAMLT